MTSSAAWPLDKAPARRILTPLALGTLMRLPLALAGMLLLAGCLAPSAVDPASVAKVDDAVVLQTLQGLLADVPCEASSVGAQTSENLLDLAKMEYDGTQHGEIDIKADWMLAARFQAGGFEVVSLADPLNPALAAIFQSEEANAQDVKWMPDNRTAVVGVNLKVLLVDVGPVLDSPLPPAETLERNVTPVLLGEWEYPIDPTNPHDSVAPNMHMLTTARLGGEDYVFVTPNTDTGVWVLKRNGDALEYVTNFGAPLGGGAIGPHDMSLVWDEILQAPVLYVANGFEGWAAYDVTDPAAPVRLGFMLNLDPAPVSYTHTVLGAKVGDRRLVVSIAEVGLNMMKVYDATDFSTPLLVGVWWADKTAPQMPQHNIQIVGDQLFMAHYTQGVFVFDLSTVDPTPLAGTASLAPVAHYAPPQQDAADTLGFGNIWDVVVHEGLLYVNDMAHGTSVVGYGCFEPGDALASSVN